MFFGLTHRQAQTPVQKQELEPLLAWFALCLCFGIEKEQLYGVGADRFIYMQGYKRGFFGYRPDNHTYAKVHPG